MKRALRYSIIVDDVLLVRIEHRVAWIALNGPAVKNAIIDALRDRLVHAFCAVARETTVPTAVVNGAWPSPSAGSPSSGAAG